MEQYFILYNLKEAHSRDFCRKKVEEIAKLKLNNTNIKLTHDKNGKPHLEYSDYYISYSHANSLLFIALSQYPIGVDLEPKIRNNELKNVQKIAFSGDDSVQNSTLIDLWCLKEASLKKQGVGFLMADPSEYSMIANDDKYKLKRQGRLVDKGFYKIIKDYDYVFAICSALRIDDYQVINKDI